MEPNTGYIITHENARLISSISGWHREVIWANIGWVAVYQENPFPRWSLMPKNAAELTPDFHYVDSTLNGLPSRSVKEIRAEWAEVNRTFGEKIEELQKELDRAKLKEEMTDVSSSDT